MQPKKKSARKGVKNAKKHARVSPKRKNFAAASPKMKIEKRTESDKKPKDSKTLLIAQEVKFARLLAGNDKRVTDKVLKNLKKWLTVRSKSSFAFTEADFIRLWKGLFYCMWMSDKPLVQEDLADSLSILVHCFNSMDTALLYTKCTLKSLATEWFGIDRYRVDKFEMLVRKIIRQTFVMCKNQSWDKQWVVGLGKAMEEILLDPKTCLGLNLHITDVYMEELAKIGEEQIPPSIVTEFVRPFVIHLASMTDQRQVKHVVKNIFRYLIFQSDVGMEYTDKFNAWREAGFPCTSIEEMQKVEVPDEEDDGEDDEEPEEEEEEERGSTSKEKPLDPRAGRVDVEIPQIPFNPAEIANVLKENKFNKSSTTLTRKHISRLIDDFTKLIKGNMPFGIKELPIPDTTRVNPYDAAKDLLNFEQEIYVDSGKNRKRKKNGNLTEWDESFIDDAKTVEENEDDDSTKLNNKRRKLKNKVNGEISENPKKSKKLKQNNQEDFSETTTKVKKLKSKKKLETLENSLSTDESELKKIIGKFNNTKKSKPDGDSSLSLKKIAERLDVSEPLTVKKKLKKTSKKLNKTVKESTPDSVNDKNSTSSSWSIDILSEISAPSTPASEVSKKKKTPSKNTDIPAKQKNTEILNTTAPWLTPVITRLEQHKTPSPKSALKQTPRTDSAKKRVQIVLQRNTAQNTSEYFLQLRQSPAIPFDANRKPKAGVLKPSPLPSPVNPFYKKKML